MHQAEIVVRQRLAMPTSPAAGSDSASTSATRVTALQTTANTSKRRRQGFALTPSNLGSVTGR